MEAALEEKLLEQFGKFLNLQYEKDYYGESFRCQKGWWMILYMFFQELESKGFDVRFSCVKEKYGYLRLYPDFRYMRDKRHSPKEMLHPDVLTMIHRMEWKSWETCEFCGNPGVIRWDFEWIRVLCDECLAGYGSKPRIWAGDIREILQPGGDLRKLAGYGRVG